MPVIISPVKEQLQQNGPCNSIPRRYLLGGSWGPVAGGGYEWGIVFTYNGSGNIYFYIFWGCTYSDPTTL